MTRTKTRALANMPNNFISVLDFGAVGDGVTNDTPYIQAAIDAVHAAGGGTVLFTKRHLIDSSLTIKDYVSLVGSLGIADELLPGTSADYDSKQGSLIVNSSATINVLDGASLSNCLLIRKGLNLPFADAAAATAGVAAFDGTAITVGGAGTYFHHLLIIGFNKAIYSNGFERIRCEYINGDNTNGIEILSCGDIAYVENCHFWPFTMVRVPSAPLTRSGTAYRYANLNDWGKLTNCFSFGYAKGFSIESADHVQLIGCGTDYVAGLSTSTGYEVSGTARNTTFIGCQAAAQGVGIFINTPTIQDDDVKIIGCDFWNNDLHAIQVVQGTALITGCSFAHCGVRVEDAARASITNNKFNNAVVSLGIGTQTVSTVLNNTYTGATLDSTVGNRISLNNVLPSTSTTIAKADANGFTNTYSLSRGSLRTPASSAEGDIPFSLVARTHDGSAFGEIGGLRFQGQATSSGSTPGIVILSSTPPGTRSKVDRLLLNNNGDVIPLADNAYKLGGTGGRWSAVWAANGTIQTSDERTKTDIAPSSLGLDFVNALNPVSYKFKEGGTEVVRQVYRDSDGNECSSDAPGAIASEIVTTVRPGERTHWGLISQDVKTAADAAGVDFGGWVLTDKDDPNSQQALRYDQFIAPLIKAVQELSAEIQILKTAAQSQE